MLLIKCPFCGEREETEFSYGGEVIGRPLESEALSDEEWGDYVFMRQNVKGDMVEQWCHSSGCGRWFNAKRNTVSYDFLETWKIGEEAPSLKDAAS